MPSSLKKNRKTNRKSWGGCGCKSSLMGGYVNAMKQQDGGNLSYGFDLNDSIGGHPAVVGMDSCTAPKILGKSFTGGYGTPKTAKRKMKPTAKHSKNAKRNRKNKTNKTYKTKGGMGDYPFSGASSVMTGDMSKRTFDGKQPEWSPADI